MTAHLDIVDLVERSDAPEVVGHLEACASCRARARLLGADRVLEPGSLEGLGEARAAMSAALQRAAQSASRSMGSALSIEGDALETGRIIERYVVEGLIGRGGMGSVYRVRHTSLGGSHALKVLPSQSRSVRDRLVREGRAQSRLRHPAVVPVTDIVDVDGAPGLVMELVDGPSLARWLRDNGPPSLEEADRLAQQIIRGVAAAHDAGIIHRDIKPGNVLLAPTDEGYVAKVCDFGLARLFEEPDLDVALTQPDTPLGTPSYMAPEQIRDGSRADPRSDIFALGAVLYELLSARRAFPGLAVVDIYDRVRAGDYTPLRERVPGVPDRMEACIAKALAVDPAERFADCRALLQAWRGEAVAVVVEPDPRRIRLGLQAGGLAVAASIALVVAAAVLLGGGDQDTATSGLLTSPVAADARVDTTDGDAGPHLVGAERRLTAQADQSQVYSVAMAPDGSRLAYSDGRGLWLDKLDASDAIELVAGGPLHNIDFFPDGEQLMASGWLDGVEGTWSVALDGSAPRLLQARTGRHVRLSPDGSRLAIADERGLWLTDLDGEDVTRLRPLAGADGTAGLVWSPSGAFVGAVHRSAAGGGTWLEITASDGSSTRRLVEDKGLHAYGIAPLAWLAPDRLLYTVTTYEDDEQVVHLRALDGVQTGAVAEAAETVHSWRGHAVLRVLPSADGGQLATSHVQTQMNVWLLPTDGGEAPTRLTTEAWREWPVAWSADGDVIVHSESGGGSIVARSPSSGRGRQLAREEASFRNLSAVGGDFLYLRATKTAQDSKSVGEEDARTPRVSAARLTPGAAPVEIVQLEMGEDDNGPHFNRLYLDCKASRCLLAEPVSDRFNLSEFDAITGRRGPTLLSLDVTARSLAWRLSPDGKRVALALADPPRLQVHTLDSGAMTERRGLIDLPEGLAWSPDGLTLYVSGLVEDAAEPYRTVAVRGDEAPRTLWSSMNQNPVALQISPDGRTLAVGVHTYDDDIYLARATLAAP